MRLTKEVQIGERRITARELTLAEVRAWLADLSGVAADLIGDDLFDGITLGELTRLCDLPAADAESMTPSELQFVVDACREANPHFFGLRARLLARGRALSSALTEPPAPWSEPATPASGLIPTASS
jgi:hypothetical protein